MSARFSPSRAAAATLLAVGLTAPLLGRGPTFASVAIFTTMFLGSAAAWNLLAGFSGYFSLGQSIFFGIGAYAVVKLADWWSVPGGYAAFALLPVAGLIAAAASLLIGGFALRSRHMTFAIVTFALLFIFQLLASNLDGITGGAIGLEAPIPEWTGDFYNVPFYYAGLAVALLAVALAWLVRRSHFGLNLVAIRDDEDRARGLGVRTFRVKLAAFALASFVAGMTGALYTLYAGSIYPNFAFDPKYDITVIICVLLGGMGTLWGPVIGTLLIVPLQQYLTLEYGVSGWDTIGFGMLFLIVLVAMPEGIVPTLSARLRQHRARRRATAAAADPDPAVAEVGR